MQDDFSVNDMQIATWAKALSHPARIEILRTLAQKRSCICGEIVEELPLAQSTVSQHLKVLKDAGFVAGESDGPRSCYCLDPGTLRRVRAAVVQLLDALAGAPSGADPNARSGTGCGC